MDPTDVGEGPDLERVFSICDTDGDGKVTKAELELILQEIGVEDEDIIEFMGGMQSDDCINYTQFVEAITKFREDQYASLIHSSPRSRAASALGGDHTDCSLTIHELGIRNSVLTKQVLSLEAQVHELSLLYDDTQKHEKGYSNDLRKLQARFSELSAELEASKQAKQEAENREKDLNRRVKQLQDHSGDIEENLNTARAELKSARSSGLESTRSSVGMTSPKFVPDLDTLAENERLKDALDQMGTDTEQMRRANEELMRTNADDQSRMSTLHARIETLTRELETKDTLFAELGLVPDKLGGVTDINGNTWLGFRNVSPLYSELGLIHDQPLHPSLVDARYLHPMSKGFDSAFLKEKVANVNEEIRRRGVQDGRKRQQQHLSGFGSSDEPGGETDTSYSVSETEDFKHDKYYDHSDLVTNQLMNLSDLLITTSDISHSHRNTPTNLRDDSSSLSDRSFTPAHAAENLDVTFSEDDTKMGVVDASVALAKGTMASPLIRANTPTPTQALGSSPDNSMHVHDSPPSTAGEKPIPKLTDTPRQPPSQSPRTPATQTSAPSTFRLDSDTAVQPDTTPVAKRMTLSKSEKIIRPASDKGQLPQDPSPYKPNGTNKTKPELVRHKSELAFTNNDLRASPGIKRMQSKEVTELQEFALKAGLIRPRTATSRVDKYAQADPAEFEPGAQIEGTVMAASSTSEQRMRRSRSQPSIAPAKTPVRTPRTQTARVAQQSDRRIVVRGNPYLIRLLSYPDPGLDDMEEVVKKLEAELDAIEDRLNNPAASSSSSKLTVPSNATQAPTVTVPTTPTTPSPPITPSTLAHSLTSSPTTSFTKRTLKPSPLVVASKPAAKPQIKYWMIAAIGALVFALLFGLMKSELSPFKSNIL